MNTAAPCNSEDQPRDLVMIGAALQGYKRAPNLRAEAAASGKLARVLATDPSAALGCTLEIARSLCHAGTAGLSSFTTVGTHDIRVRWEAVRGALAHYEGIDRPSSSSPCSLCLDAGKTILVSRPARAFAWLQDTRPSISEELIVPLQDDKGAVMGTLWVAHHERTSRFCADDVRIVEQLADQLVLAMELQRQGMDRKHALTLLQSHQVAQQSLLAHDLYRERSLRKQAEATESEARRALEFKDAMMHEVNHRTKNTLQAAAALLSLQAHATSHTEVRRALMDGQERLQLLADVHALLSKDAGDMQSVFMPTLLQKVCDALRQSFGGTRSAVRLQVAFDPISLSVEDAIPVALIANEAVTNAYKHAFQNESAGEITVLLHRTPEHAIALRIADNGVGANGAAGADTEGRMGLKLMRVLAAQLRGVLSLDEHAHAGTQITLTIDHAATRTSPTTH